MLGSLCQFQKKLLKWYSIHRRDLPWRTPRTSSADALPNPYHVLLSETMLQQTQVATVVPYFRRFIDKLPTLADLAGAEEQDVLRLWQGLGYYSRARNLRKAAGMIVQQFGGIVPSTVEKLLELPGVGRYTAGAIASIAFGGRAAILDGNVARVLCRIWRIEEDPRSPKVRARLWEKAEEVLPHEQIGDFNSAVMELGATVCSARRPSCLHCPVRDHCAARAGGVQERIPLRAPAKQRPTERRWVICIKRQSQWLIEQRPLRGRWAGMWQFVTLRAERTQPSASLILARTGQSITPPRHVGKLTHELTHRHYEFEVYACKANGTTAARQRVKTDNGGKRAWVALDRLSDYPLPRPHLKIAQMLEGFSD
jgi:A/G-specific adenine glycosylase